MPENRNPNLGLSFDTRGTVCIDTNRVFDCCRDRDCFEDTRVYLTAEGEQLIEAATGIRTKSAEIIWAYVGVEDVPFSPGFYQVTVRTYLLVECEVCLGIGRSQNILGIAVVEKNVILYGGEGRIVSYSSSPENNYCAIGNPDTVSNNDPTAIVDTVPPIVLGTRIDTCPRPCCKGEFADFPDTVKGRIGAELIVSDDVARLYISVGLFSVIRIVRPAQLLVTASDYSVPEKECVPSGNEDNPCALFQSMPFPEGQFRGRTTPAAMDRPPRPRCGCNKGEPRE